MYSEESGRVGGMKKRLLLQSLAISTMFDVGVIVVDVVVIVDVDDDVVELLLTLFSFLI